MKKICARDGCDNTFEVDDKRPSIRLFCSSWCAAESWKQRQRERIDWLRKQRGWKLHVVEPKNYAMKCLNCEEMYDGREGPLIGICSLPCVGAYAIKQASAAVEERERRRA